MSAEVSGLPPSDDGLPALQALDRVFGMSSANTDGQKSDEFKRRLLSFTTVAYYARPVCLSPTLCAASGWEIRTRPHMDSLSSTTSPPSADSISILACSSCGSHLAVKIPQSLSSMGQRKILVHYQQQLWEAHAITCLHHHSARSILSGAEEATKVTDTGTTTSLSMPRLVIPTAMSRMLPSTSVALDLLECFDPRRTFTSQWLKLYPIVLAMDQPMQLPDSKMLHEYKGDEFQSPTSVLSHLIQMTKTVEKEGVGDITLPALDSVAQVQAAETCMCLVLSGWDIIANTDEPSVVHCSLCLSKQELVRVEGGLLDSPDTDARKRRRTTDSKWNQPLTAHRYYCPWVCGLPRRSDPLTNGPPLWETMTRHMLRARPRGDTNATDTAIEIHKLLRYSLAPTNVET